MLGRPVTTEEYGRLETFPADPNTRVIEMNGDELTALCPAVAGLQPDFYRWTIRYSPNGSCIESKSLKLYLLTFRDVAIFAEHLAPRMAREIAAVLDTEVYVRLVQKSRGGIEIAVEATAR